MTTYLLDADVCVYAMAADPVAVAFLKSRPDGASFISALALAQIEAGIERGSPRGQLHAAVLATLLKAVTPVAFDAAAARAYGDVVARRGYSRKHAIDHMIAAQAISLGAALVTNNVRDFGGISGLTLEDWRAAAP